MTLFDHVVPDGRQWHYYESERYSLCRLATLRDHGNEFSEKRLLTCGAAQSKSTLCGAPSRDELILFYGRLCRRSNAITAAIMLKNGMMVHEAITEETIWDPDTLEGLWDQVDDLGILKMHLADLISRCNEADPLAA